MRRFGAILWLTGLMLAAIFGAMSLSGCAANARRGDPTHATGAAIDQSIWNYNALAKWIVQIAPYLKENGKALIPVGERFIVDGKGANVIAAIELAKVRQEVEAANTRADKAEKETARVTSTVGYQVEMWVKALGWITLALTIIAVIGIGVILVWFPTAPFIGGFATQALHALPVMQVVVWPLRALKWLITTVRQPSPNARPVA